MKKEIKREKRYRRHRRVRAKIFGTARRPRLCVFKSSKHIYAQLIDDEKGRTLATASDRELNRKTQSEKRKATTKNLKQETTTRTGKVAIAYEVGKLIAAKALEKKIEKVVFDRGGYKYHGRAKALTDGSREGGLKF